MDPRDKHTVYPSRAQLQPGIARLMKRSPGSMLDQIMLRATEVVRVSELPADHNTPTTQRGPAKLFLTEIGLLNFRCQMRLSYQGSCPSIRPDQANTDESCKKVQRHHKEKHDY